MGSADGLEIHLIGLDQDEATASLDEHGEMTSCRHKGCTQPAVMMLMMKKPGSGFGQDIGATSACADHRAELDRTILSVIRKTGGGPQGES